MVVSSLLTSHDASSQFIVIDYCNSVKIKSTMRPLNTILLSLAIASHASAQATDSLIVYDTPQSPRPYVLPKGYGLSQPGNIYPVTGNSSGGAFCLLITNGAGTNGAGVNATSGLFAHVHRKTHEMFYASKGRVQVWSQSYEEYLASGNNSAGQRSRMLTQGDIGSVAPNTIHTFRLADPDTSLTGALVPGGFEELFFQLAADPTLIMNPDRLATLDVYPQLDFQPLANLESGAEPEVGPQWHNEQNVIPEAADPYFVAKGFGPKYLNSENGYYQVVATLVTPASSNGWFGEGTITMSRRKSNQTVPEIVLPGATAMLLEEGQLAVEVGGQTASLIEGDTFFVPANTSFKYSAEASFTKFLYVTQGSQGLDTMLLKNSVAWDSSFYPADGDELGQGEAPSVLAVGGDVQGRAMLAGSPKPMLPVRI